jgi:hypothetical protein
MPDALAGVTFFDLFVTPALFLNEIPMSRTYLSRTQAAKHVGRCAKTMRNLAKRGEGPPFIMIGTARPAYPLDALECWLTAITFGRAS